jgi:hypothetical protein
VLTPIRATLAEGLRALAAADRRSAAWLRAFAKLVPPGD